MLQEELEKIPEKVVGGIAVTCPPLLFLLMLFSDSDGRDKRDSLAASGLLNTLLILVLLVLGSGVAVKSDGARVALRKMTPWALAMMVFNGWMVGAKYLLG